MPDPPIGSAPVYGLMGRGLKSESKAGTEGALRPLLQSGGHDHYPDRGPRLPRGRERLGLAECGRKREDQRQRMHEREPDRGTARARPVGRECGIDPVRPGQAEEEHQY